MEEKIIITLWNCLSLPSNAYANFPTVLSCAKRLNHEVVRSSSDFRNRVRLWTVLIVAPVALSASYDVPGLRRVHTAMRATEFCLREFGWVGRLRHGVFNSRR